MVDATVHAAFMRRGTRRCQVGSHPTAANSHSSRFIMCVTIAPRSASSDSTAVADVDWVMILRRIQHITIG